MARKRGPLREGTIDHFRAYARLMVLDTGDQWKPERFQLDVVAEVLNGVPEVWLDVPEGNGKALDLHTPLPTPLGWTTMGDVQVGDLLLGSDGRAVKVTATSRVMTGRPCYRVVFSDGAEVVADGEHLWVVEDAQSDYRARTVSTEQLRAIGLTMSSGARRWRVRTAARVGDDRAARLPVDPYVLGAWLGDGAVGNGRISVPDEYIWERIQAAGYELGREGPATRCRTHTVLGLKDQLAALGVLHDKHIPDRYLLSSIEQRRALLQGLVDTDGTVSKAGQLTLATSSPVLRDQARVLAWSLGRPTHVAERRARLNGRDYGPAWGLTIACDRTHKLVALPRKAERLKVAAKAAEHRRIVAIEPVESRPVKCVQVDTPDRLYLAGEALIPTHNTTLMAGVALYHGDYTPGALVTMAAASRDQTGVLLGQAAGFVYRTPGLASRFVVQEGNRRIKCLRTGGRIQVFAADDRTGDGVIPTLALLEELHRHPDLRLYRTWRGKLEKRGGQLIAISTAGEPGGEYENAKAAVLKRGKVTRTGAHTVARARDFVLHQHALAPGDDLHDIKVVKQANPFSGATVAGLRRKHNSPTMLESHWARFVCGIPTRGDQAAITPAEWAALSKTTIPAGESVWAGVDLGWKWDTTAIVPFWMPEPERRVIGKPEIIVPPRNGTSTSPEEIRAAARRIHARTPVHTWVVEDAAGAEQFVEWLQQTFPQARVVLWGNGNAPQSLAFDRWMQALREGWLAHPHDDLLTQHVLNAVAKAAGPDRYRFDRPRTTRQARGQDQRVIDALSAASAVHAVAVADDEPDRPEINPADFRIVQL